MTGEALREIDGDDELPGGSSPLSELIESAIEAAEKTVEAHRKFLEFSNEITRS